MSFSRLVIAGASGFIGAHVAAEAGRQDIDVLTPGRLGLEAALAAGDVIVACGVAPAYRSSPYDAALDIEGGIAELAARKGARLIMLSTRRVYPATVRWGAREDQTANGDETIYGQNKAITERRVLEALGDQACILRLSNVFGFEYLGLDNPRPSFFGMMMHRLRTRDEILLDMSPATRRDFIPVEAVARGVIDVSTSGAAGIFNLGGGGPIACGDLAEALLAGYGRGRLTAGDIVQDEFYLDTSRWTERFGPLVRADLIETARCLGERLRDA